MKLENDIINRIKDALKPLDLCSVILFGSYARGDADIGSDIDLYVVTNDDFVPADWHQKNELYLKVSREIRDFRSEIPIDLIVHTKSMNKKFIELNSHFSREITQNGISLL